MSEQPEGLPRLARDLSEEFFPAADGELTIGGLPATRLAAEYGTPLYVYDAELLRARLGMLRRHLPDEIDVYYSAKANPNPAVIQVFVEAGAGVEIASGAEYVRARSATAAPGRIVFAGPAKSDSEVAMVVARGVGEIHAESEGEIDRLATLAQRMGIEIPAALRVNPIATAGGGAMRMGGQPAQFGIDEERIEEAVRRVMAHEGLRFTGIHMFAGTQILDAETLALQWKHALEVAVRASDVAAVPLETVDLGGGLGIPYFAHETALDLAHAGERAAEVLASFRETAALEGAHVILEPGRFLAGPAGVYLARVLDVKESRGRRFVLLDGGMHHHLAASGNLGQVIKRDYPVLHATRMGADVGRPCTIVGPLCTPLDTLARNGILPETRPGDLIAVLQSGAYGLTASPVGFLSHPMPAEVLVEAGGSRLIRARGTVEQPIVPLP